MIRLLAVLALVAVAAFGLQTWRLDVADKENGSLRTANADLVSAANRLREINEEREADHLRDLGIANARAVSRETIVAELGLAVKQLMDIPDEDDCIDRAMPAGVVRLLQ